MTKVSLRKIKPSDKKYFASWWRDKELLKLTSGILKRISDQEVDQYFQGILTNEDDYHFIISLNRDVIGHISLVKRKNNWFETQIVIGERKCRGQGYGTRAIGLLLSRAKKLGISKVYLEVRPNNTSAIKAYEKSGFRKMGVKKYPNNKYLPEVLRMELM